MTKNLLSMEHIWTKYEPRTEQYGFNICSIFTQYMFNTGKYGHIWFRYGTNIEHTVYCINIAHIFSTWHVALLDLAQQSIWIVEFSRVLPWVNLTFLYEDKLHTHQTECVKLQRSGFNPQVVILQAGWRVKRTGIHVKLTPHNGFTTFKQGLHFTKMCSITPEEVWIS